MSTATTSTLGSCTATVLCRLSGPVPVRSEQSPTGSVFLALGDDAVVQLWVTDAQAAAALVRAAIHTMQLFEAAAAVPPSLSVVDGGRS